MGKIIFTSIISIFAFISFFFNGVLITSNLPSELNAGDEITIEVRIKKGSISGFARFQQEWPVGFTVVEKVSANGEFRFADQKVTLQWMQLPYDDEIVIRYNLQVAPAISGTFKIGGKFSYIDNNQRATTELEPITLTIKAGDLSATGTDFGTTTSFKYGDIYLREIDCIRQKPSLNENNEIVVNLLVNKGDKEQFGKIQEQVPRGYTASSVISKNSIFTFKSSIVKFLWMTLPPEPQFVVSYKLVPINEIPDQAFIINGTFSYAENERTKVIDILERNIDISSFDTDKLVAEVKDIHTTEDKTITDVVVTETETQQDLADVTQQEQTEDITKTQEVITDDTKTIEETEEKIEDKVIDVVTEDLAYEETKIIEEIKTVVKPRITNVPEPDAGVTYRVQLAAGHKLVNEKYFKKLNIKDHIQIEIHQGWHKYTVGSFPVYKQARNYRIYIWDSTPIKDAFVSAYNNGQRITVQEALMIANQEWYK